MCATTNKGKKIDTLLVGWNKRQRIPPLAKPGSRWLTEEWWNALR